MHSGSRPSRPVLLAMSLAALAVAPMAAPAPATAQPAPVRGLDGYVEAAMEAWGVPGLGLAIVKDGEVVLARGYGVRSLETREPVDEHTIFAIGSASKAFTTAALAILVDEGRLSWDDRVVDVLPAFRLSDAWVTQETRVRDLVTHRVGIERADRLWGGTTHGRDEVMRRTAHLPFVDRFRADYGYNNLMFLAAGEVVEAVSGISWDAFLETRIFGPLGMQRTTTSVDPLPRLGNDAKPHERVDGAVRPVPWLDIDNVGPAGSINSTATDMARWALLQLDGGEHAGRRVISEAQVSQMHAPQIVIPLEEWGASLSPVNHQMVPGTHFFAYGLGWFLQDYRGRKLVHHGGSIQGMRALVLLVPEEELGVVVLTNRGGSSLMNGIAFHVMDRYLGEPVRDWAGDLLAVVRPLEERAEADAARLEASRIPNTTPSLPLSAYAGVYEQPAQGTLRIAVEGDRLRFEMTGHTGSLEHWHHDTFRGGTNHVPSRRFLLTFHLDARGRADALTIAGFGAFERVRAEEGSTN